MVRVRGVLDLGLGLRVWDVRSVRIWGMSWWWLYFCDWVGVWGWVKLLRLRLVVGLEFLLLVLLFIFDRLSNVRCGFIWFFLFFLLLLCLFLFLFFCLLLLDLLREKMVLWRVEVVCWFMFVLGKGLFDEEGKLLVLKMGFWVGVVVNGRLWMKEVSGRLER